MRTIHFSYNFLSSMKIVGVQVFADCGRLSGRRSIDRYC